MPQGATYGGIAPAGNPGGNDNFMATRDAKVFTVVRSGIDLTTADIVYIGEHVQTDCELVSAKLRLEGAPVDDDTDIVLGCGPLAAGAVPDDDDLATLSVDSSGAAEGDEFEFTLTDTRRGTGNRRGSIGHPVIPAGTPIYASVDGVPDSDGAGTIILSLLPLDNNTK